MVRYWQTAVLAGSGWLLAAQPASAHALGGRYDLPLPLGFYLAGAGLAVALSFFGAVALVGQASSTRHAGRIDLLGGPAGHERVRQLFRSLFGAFGLALLAFMVITGLLGSERPAANPAVTLAWVVFWVGGAYLSAITGDAWWRGLNPWHTAFRLWERLATRLGWRTHLAWPAPHMHRWPAVALLALVFWLELVYPDSAQPRTLALLILAYSIVTWTAMALYGPRRWLYRGEAFGALFREFARLAPLGYRPANGADRPQMAIRAPGAGLTPEDRVSRSTTLLVLLLLAAVSFDGLTATPQWSAAWRTLTTTELLQGTFRSLEHWGLNGYTVVSTIAFAATVGVFAGLYVAACGAAARLAARVRPSSRQRVHTDRFIDTFAVSLLPIGVGYHLAHYFTYLLIQGQRLVAQLSDPFGTGADWLGGADYRVQIAIVSPATVWYVAVIAVVGGHVIAVYAAHRIALASLGDRRAAAASQLPLVLLMIGYTVFSLWLFAQPTVEIG